MLPCLVSVIIPCYNAERWVREAIQSCLDQTYRPIEIIVIDDGSTDGSLAVIKSFGDAVRSETGPNRGGCAARNRGIALSRGRYIQFLDADDYILPQKIEHQVSHLEATGDDGVYGDWLFQYHYNSDDSVSGNRFVKSDPPGDLITALLEGSWWVASNALLWQREAVIHAKGWDEQLRIGQDFDFFVSMLLSDSKVSYLPGQSSVYRHYGSPRVSSKHQVYMTVDFPRILSKAETALHAAGHLLPKYKEAMAQHYLRIARACYDTDRVRYRYLLGRALSLCPQLRPEVPLMYNLLRVIVGFEFADLISSHKRSILQVVTSLRFQV
jgi:glycosyltransferase involved in cell wall biosynthesis